MNNHVNLSSKKSLNQEGIPNEENAFLVIIDLFRNVLLDPSISSVDSFKEQINNVYLKAETASLRQKLLGTDFSNVRIVFRPNGKFALRNGNTHVSNKQVMSILGCNSLFQRLDAMSYIYKAATCLML
jgi:hypothetical protein